MAYEALGLKEQERKKIKDEMIGIKAIQEELELDHEERWAGIKDYILGNDYYKIESFKKWVAKQYNPQKSGLAIQLKNAIEKHDNI